MYRSFRLINLVFLWNEVWFISFVQQIGDLEARKNSADKLYSRINVNIASVQTKIAPIIGIAYLLIIDSLFAGDGSSGETAENSADKLFPPVLKLVKITRILSKITALYSR